MNENSISFGPNRTLVIIPALFWSSFVILFLMANDFAWAWGFFFAAGMLSLLAYLAQWRVYEFNKHKMIISGPLSTKSIALNDIESHDRRTLTRRGIHYYTWTLKIRNNKKLIIMSDYMKDAQGFRKAFELWLKQADDK